MTIETYWDPILRARRAKDTSEGAPAGGWDLSTLAQEVIDSIAAKYTKPETDIPIEDLEQAVQDALVAQDIKKATIQLAGVVQTPVSFVNAVAATKTSANAETYDLTGVGNGGTLIFNTDAAGNQTTTFNFTKAKSVSGASPATDISAGVDNKFKISVDGAEAQEVTLSLVSCDTGAHIATEMQTKIQALGGVFANVTVDYNVTTANKYTIQSGTLGSGSNVVITAAALNNCTEELKLGTAGGAETAGTGDVINAAAVTAAEIAAIINTDCNKLTATVDDDDKVVITSKTTGRTSDIVIGNGTLNAVVGFTNTNHVVGSAGLGFAANKADANYIVMATIKNTAGGSLAGKALSITNKTTSGFMVECETAAATDYVDLLILA